MSVFVIAEAGVNHNGNIELAIKLIDAAVFAGCDAIKFQTFSAKNLVLKDAIKAEYQKKNTGSNETQYEMLKKLELSYKDHEKLIEYCNSKKIKFLSTPFDEDSANMLDKLGLNIFKIPSGEITNKYFLKHIAKKDKQIILSTGMSTLEEVEEALNWIYEEGNKNIALLHCTSNYPTFMHSVNLNAMKTLKDAFKLKVGYSDHTEGIEIAIAAVAMGASIIEKHLTLDRNMEGPDHKASLEPDDLKAMTTAIRNVEIAFGDGIKRPMAEELETKNVARKSIVTKVQIHKDDLILENMLCFMRPGTGLKPSVITDIIGKRAKVDIPANHLLKIEEIY